MFRRANVGQTKGACASPPSMEVIRNENHDSSVDQSPQKRKDGKGKGWQWKGRKTGNS